MTGLLLRGSERPLPGEIVNCDVYSTPVQDYYPRAQRMIRVETVETVRTSRHTWEHVVNGKGGIGPMANHLTPSELARESGLERRDVIVKCVQLGVPIFNGRIDKTLFLSSLRELSGSQAQQRPQPAGA
jgi:hypothetical protein